MKIKQISMMVVLFLLLSAQSFADSQDSVTVFGITITQVNDALRKQYNLKETDNVIVTKVEGEEYKRIGITELKPGYVIATVSDYKHRIHHSLAFPERFIERVLEVAKKPEEKNTPPEIKDMYICRVVFVYYDSNGESKYLDKYLKFSEKDLDYLKKNNKSGGIKYKFKYNSNSDISSGGDKP